MKTSSGSFELDTPRHEIDKAPLNHNWSRNTKPI
jgi:hypothetical protein